MNLIRQANSGATRLCAAGLECDMDILRLLVEEGNANVNTVSACGATPLLVALRQNIINGDVLRFLLSVGARPCIQ
jgi:ankyrin repeat protein